MKKVFEKNIFSRCRILKKVYFCSLKSRGLLAQWFRALLSHGRGHRFNSYTTHKKRDLLGPFFDY